MTRIQDFISYTLYLIICNLGTLLTKVYIHYFESILEELLSECLKMNSYYITI